MPPPSPDAALDELLSELFNSHELVRFVTRTFSPALAKDLPSTDRPLSELASALTDLLRRRGLITAEFFADLARVAPKKRPAIAAVAALWGQELPPSAPSLGNSLTPLTRVTRFRWRITSIRTGILVGSFFIVLSILAIYRMDPAHVPGLASGIPTSLCRADHSGSTLQLFANGWMLARFSENRIYSFIENADEDVAWERHEDVYKGVGTAIGCPDDTPGEALIRRGFRAVYCAPENRQLRLRLGAPLTEERRVIVQYQEWTEGLLIYGFPTNTPGMLSEGSSFSKLAALFLERPDRQRGAARKAAWIGGAGGSSYCSAAWYTLHDDATVELPASCGGDTKPVQLFRLGRLRCSD